MFVGRIMYKKTGDYLVNLHRQSSTNYSDGPVTDVVRHILHLMQVNTIRTFWCFI